VSVDAHHNGIHPEVSVRFIGGTCSSAKKLKTLKTTQPYRPGA